MANWWMQRRKSKADKTVEGICITLTYISKVTAFYHSVTNCGLGNFQKIVTNYFPKAIVCNTLIMRKVVSFEILDKIILISSTV